jgi:tetratricopeptide (TPR) repeat protein
VQLTESASPGDDELPIAYNNLGVAQLRVGDLDAAEASFDHVLELLEDRVGIVSRRLIAPLAGLGAVHTARGNHALAADSLQRALAISRRANGLFNIDQMELLESLVENYRAAGNKPGVERERRYAMQIVQQEYGFDDPRTIPATVLLAEWYEKTDRYALARAQWQQVVAVASRESGGRNTATILGLIGIARNHRLQFVLHPESLEAAQVPIDPWTGRPNPIRVAESAAFIKLDREGETAALQALTLLDETPDPPKTLLSRALTELGDWYVTTNKLDTSLPYYRRAWPLFAETMEAGEPNPLAVPRPLLYRPPAAAVSNRDRTDVEIVPTSFEFTMNISATGETDSVTLVSSDSDSDSGDFRAAQIRRSLNRALFSPRFEDGEPVATEDYRFTEIWYDVVPSAPRESSGEPKPQDKEPAS